MNSKRNIIKSAVNGSLIILLFVVIFNSCKVDPVIWVPTSDKMVIADILDFDSNAYKYSEFDTVVKSTGLDALLSVRGPYTLFVPTNAAVEEYCKLHNVKSMLDLSQEERRELVLNHMIMNEIQTADIGLGALRSPNGLGDKLVSEFSGADIIINKGSKIVKRDIRAANGFVHDIDRVIEPVKTNIYDLIKSNPAYSLFAKGLELTGFKDTLQIIEFPYGKKTARTDFTILAVPDTIYNRYGINTIDDMIRRYTDDPNSLTSMENGFYRYMEYHCLGGTFYLSDFVTKLYPIFSYDNNIDVVISDDYKLNYNKADSTYTSFIIDQSNIPAKNGALHTINDLLPVQEPEPKALEIETTDYFDLKQGDYYGKYYMKWYDGENTFEFIKWKGDYLQYYYKDHDAPTQVNWDCLNMLGYWEIEVTTPKIMKGSYALSGYVWEGNVDYEIWVDGVYKATSKRTDTGRPVWGDVHWTKTERHKIKLIALTYGTLFWDTITLKPL